MNRRDLVTKVRSDLNSVAARAGEKLLTRAQADEVLMGLEQAARAVLTEAGIPVKPPRSSVTTTTRRREPQPT